MKTWLLWNLRCRRGRLCADLRPAYPIEEMLLPPGAIAQIEYRCGSCGGKYRWTSDTQERIRIREFDGPPTPMTIGPGESAEVLVEVDMP